jgi:hypothetical protein
MTRMQREKVLGGYQEMGLEGWEVSNSDPVARNLEEKRASKS